MMAKDRQPGSGCGQRRPRRKGMVRLDTPAAPGPNGRPTTPRAQHPTMSATPGPGSGSPTSGTAAIQGVEVSWDRAAELFSLDPSVHHLNHGSFGAVPIPVQRAQQRLRDEMDANPMAFFTRGLPDRLAHTRRHLAAFLGADPDGTALVPNATAATAIVLASIGLIPGDEILLTNHGYGTVPMAAQRSGLRVTEAEFGLAADDDEIVAAVLAAVRPGRTRLVVADQITSPTAKLLPVARIAAALR